MRPVNRGIRIAGPAVTASSAPADNLMMHRSLFLARKGDVLVVQTAGVGAQWGDIAALYAKHNGLEGVVVDGYVRDSDALESMRFPAWSTLIGPSSPDKKGHGTANAPIVCDGVLVEPGDLVVADGDGVVVIPRAEAAEVVARAKQRMAREQELLAAIQSGEHPWNFIGAAGYYAKLDVEEIDGPWRPQQPTSPAKAQKG